MRALKLIFVLAFVLVYANAWAAREFDGVDDYIYHDPGHAISTFMSGTTGTITAWIYMTGTSPSVINTWDGHATVSDAGAYLGIYRGIFDGLDRIWAYNYDGSDDRAGLAYSSNTWHFVAWVHSAGTLYLYLDGAVASVASGTTSSISGGLHLGRNNGIVYLSGRMADVRLFSTALTAEEINNIRFGAWVGSPTGWFPLWGIGGSAPITTEPDMSGNARHFSHMVGTLRVDHPPGIGFPLMTSRRVLTAAIAAAPTASKRMLLLGVGP